MTGIEQALIYVRQIKNIEAEIQKLTSFVESVINKDYKIVFKAEPIVRKTKKAQTVAPVQVGTRQVLLVRDMQSLGNILRGYTGANQLVGTPETIVEDKVAEIKINATMLCKVTQMLAVSLLDEKNKLQVKLDKLIKKEGSDKLIVSLLQAYE